MPAGRPKGYAKTGGRKTGTPNKINSDATALMNEFGFDPIKGMMSIAADLEVEVAIRAKMFSELAQYVYPKKRSVENRFVDAEGRDRPLQLSDLDRIASDVSE